MNCVTVAVRCCIISLTLAGLKQRGWILRYQCRCSLLVNSLHQEGSESVWRGEKFTQHWQHVRHRKTAGWNLSETLTSVPHLNTEEDSRPKPVSNVMRETFECIGCSCTCHPQLLSHVWMKPTFLFYFFCTDALAEKQGGIPAAPNYSSTGSCRAVFWFM